MEIKIGYVAISEGIGFLAGFILASVLYTLGGYSLPFVGNGAILLIS